MSATANRVLVTAKKMPPNGLMKKRVRPAMVRMPGKIALISFPGPPPPDGGKLYI